MIGWDTLRAWWQQLDELIGRVLRRELPESVLRGLRGALVILCLTGCVMALLRPTLAAVTLIFPLLVTSFFEGVGAGLCLSPWMIAIFARGASGLDVMLFAALCLFSVLISGVTSGKYREIFLHRQGLLTRLEIARQVQCGMEPAGLVVRGELRTQTRMEVCHELGGDFVAIFSAPDQATVLVMGDVQGKGPQSALTAAYLQGVFQECCYEGLLDPEQILTHLHRSLEGRHETRFVTALCLHYSSGGSLKFANAGHPKPIVIGMAGPRMVGGAGVVLGLSGIFELATHTTRLMPGESVLLMSDGYYEEETVSPALAALLRTTGLEFSALLSWMDANSDKDRDDRTVVFLTRSPDGE